MTQSRKPDHTKSENKLTMTARFSVNLIVMSAEWLTLYPLDRMQTLIRNSKQQLNFLLHPLNSYYKAKEIFYNGNPNKNIITTLYEGGTWGAIAKTSAFVKFFLQPYLVAKLSTHNNKKAAVPAEYIPMEDGASKIDKTDPSYRFHHMVEHLVAAVGAGAVESLISVPLDTIKTQLQTRAQYWQQRGGWLAIVRQEQWHLFTNSLTSTLARNIPGSMTLFGTHAGVKAMFRAHEDAKLSHNMQNLTASLVAAIATQVMTNPQELIRTRQQAANKNNTLGTRELIKKIYQEEGLTTFFTKSLDARILNSGLKLTFRMYFMAWLTDKYLEHLKAQATLERSQPKMP